MLNGLGWEGTANNLQYAKILGANAVRTNLAWKYVEPDLIPDGEAYSVDWAKADAQIIPYYNSGMDVMCRIGVGFGDCMPLVNGKVLTPETLEPDGYIKAICRHISNVVHKYDGKVHTWIIEGELNEAPLAKLFGWRAGYRWSDAKFLTTLISSMYTTVKSNCTANAMICFHTDIHPNIHHDILGGALAGRFSWTEWLARWIDYTDSVGIDTYPNYYAADPTYGRDVSDKIVAAKAITDKPIYIMETSYPIPKPGDVLPDPVDFTEEKQLEYVTDAYEASGECDGFFYFAVKCAGVKNDYTAKDLNAISILGEAFRAGGVEDLTAFINDNLSYCQSRLPKVLQNVESGLGIIRSDGSQTPAFDYLRSKYIGSNSITYEYNLDAGWNLISFPIHPIHTNPNVLFAPIQDKLDGVWSKDPMDNNWKIYSPDAPINNLSYIDSGIGYWISLYEPATLSTIGVPDNNAIHLIKGWNLVGFNSLEDKPISECVAQVSSDIISIWRYSPTGGWTWYISKSPRSSNITHMSPGIGYWVEASAECDWAIE